ncbi:MAG TPA: LiaF domain-containing protein, partial [candidate division Zixibacteria bacterium]|nr:LiaF domain-containing protein [candidate division Zixibacteria bacterium]
MSFSGGAGSFDLDFRGALHGEARADIEIGLGSADIILPSGTAVRIETEGNNWLSSIDFDKRGLDEIDDGVYESPDFDKAHTKIVLNLQVGMGSIKIVWK